MSSPRTTFTSLTIFPGTTRNGKKEEFNEIIIRPGDTVSIVGSTGSGKTAFINDIEVFAQGDTITNRHIFINGSKPADDLIRHPSRKPIAMITQNTKCFADMSVKEFLDMHIRSRKLDDTGLMEETVRVANEFTGEKITPDMQMTSLSGGQTRSIFVADAVVISDTPIILLDEVENAGIFKDRVIQELHEAKKVIIFVTHDPYVALLTKTRIVMGNGAVVKILTPGSYEEIALAEVAGIDANIMRLRERIRSGELISGIEEVIV